MSAGRVRDSHVELSTLETDPAHLRAEAIRQAFEEALEEVEAQLEESEEGNE